VASSNFARWTGLVAIIAGALYIVRGILSPLHSGRLEDFDSPVDYAGYAILAIALLTTLVAVVGVLLQQVGGQGFLTRACFLAAFVGFGLMFASVIVETLSAGAAGQPLRRVDLLFLTIGQLLLAIAIIRAGVVPRWSGWALLIGLAGLFVLLDNGGWILFGFGWAALGIPLWSGEGRYAR
jgi:hypothetical protein